jgi:hypothetical protein
VTSRRRPRIRDGVLGHRWPPLRAAAAQLANAGLLLLLLLLLLLPLLSSLSSSSSLLLALESDQVRAARLRDAP